MISRDDLRIASLLIAILAGIAATQSPAGSGGNLARESNDNRALSPGHPDEAISLQYGKV
jgi:hypothetical protein